MWDVRVRTAAADAAHVREGERVLRPGEAEPDTDDDEHEGDAGRGGDAVEGEVFEEGVRGVGAEEEERPEASGGGSECLGRGRSVTKVCAYV